MTLQRGCSESLRICLQSSYSRLCGGDRRLRSFAGAQATSSMTTAFGERRRGQVPLYLLVMNDTISSASGIFSVWRMVLLRW